MFNGEKSEYGFGLGRHQLGCLPCYCWKKDKLLFLAMYSVTDALGIFQKRPIRNAFISPEFNRLYAVLLPMLRSSWSSSSVISWSLLFSNILQSSFECMLYLLFCSLFWRWKSPKTGGKLSWHFRYLVKYNTVLNNRHDIWVLCNSIHKSV